MAVVFLLYVIAEVAAVWAVGSAIGVLPTIGLLIAGAILGSWLARREGGKAMRAFVDTARAGKPAHKEITDGMLIALGGLLILLPGFVSDIAGLVLLLPTRRVVRKAWLRRIEKRAPTATAGAPFGGMRGGRPNERVIVVDSEVVDGSMENDVADGNAEPGGAANGNVVDGTVVDGTVSQDRGPRSRPSARPVIDQP